MNFFKTRAFTAISFFILGAAVSWFWSHRPGIHFHVEKNITANEMDMQDPFEEMRRLQQQMMSGVQQHQMFTFDSPDLKDEGNHYSMEIELNGMKPRQFNVQVEKGQLMVQGALGSAEENSSINSRFERSFPVPPDVDADRIQVQTKDDRIVVTLPKKSK